MDRILERSRYLVLLAVIASLVASAAAFSWGVYKTIKVVIEMVTTNGDDIFITVSLIELMDKFLIAIGLYIFAIGIYELFIHELKLREWLVVRNLHQIKSRLSSFIILVMAIVFLERLVAGQDPQGTLYYAIGVAVVSAALIAFTSLGENE